MSLAEKVPLNLGLMANPYNWVIVTLMVAIAGLSLSLLVNAPSTQDN